MDKKNVLVLLAQGLPHDILGYRIGVKGRGRRETGTGALTGVPTNVFFFVMVAVS